MPYVYADTETYCETPINQGTHRYAEKVEIILWAYAKADGPVQIWDLTSKEPMPADLAGMLADPEYIFVFHNSSFDRTVIRHGLNIDLPAHRIHDTMVQAYCHGLPGALETLCDVLAVDADKVKDKAGKQLIQLFCKPQPANRAIHRATAQTHPIEWARFKDYAQHDIIAMREVHRKLPNWNYAGSERALWVLDQTINDRGFLVDTEFAEAAVRAVDKAQAALSSQVQLATRGEVTSATQRDVLLEHILQAYGVDLPDMQASTLETRLDDPNLPEEVKELLRIRLQATTASTAKYRKLLQGVSSDGRLRGTIQFCGASRTGRDAGRLFQPQNLPRSSMRAADVAFGIEAIRADAADLFYDNVMELASNAIRGCIIAPKGRKLVVADLSNIEGRVAAWLAGEEWKLQAFRDYDAGTGPDLYALAYAKAFNTSPEEVMEDKEHGTGIKRQIGKVMELFLQYEGGVGAFLTGAATYRIDLALLSDVAWPNIPMHIKEQALDFWGWAEKNKRTFGLDRKTFMVLDSLKRMWREAHPAISSYWPELGAAAINAVAGAGHVQQARRVKFIRQGAWLRCVLPSGRALCYAAPSLKDGKLQYKGINQYSRKWGNLSTYGGKLMENICQAVARDVFKGTNMHANNTTTYHNIEAAGYDILLSVHDELITEAPDAPKYNAENLAGLMVDAPLWAEGLPLAAAGFETYRYRKG